MKINLNQIWIVVGFNGEKTSTWSEHAWSSKREALRALEAATREYEDQFQVSPDEDELRVTTLGEHLTYLEE